MSYIYCQDVDPGWEVREGDDDDAAAVTLTSAVFYGLTETEGLEDTLRARRVGDAEWKTVSELKPVVKRIAFGQLLPKLFAYPKLCWYYKGQSGEIQGPFTGRQMAEWFKGGYLYEEMQIQLQADLADFVMKEKSVTLERLLLLWTQPVYGMEPLIPERLMADCRQIHCCNDSYMSFVGAQKLIQGTSDPYPELQPLGRTRSRYEEEFEVQRAKDCAQRLLSRYRDAALKLFCGGHPRDLWYYLGQLTQQTIHGPYEGARIFAWFDRGWLGLDVQIWSTQELDATINIKHFRSIQEHLDTLLLEKRQRCNWV